MPSFSKRSKDRLATCHPELQLLFEEVVKVYDCSVLCGHRTEEEQNEAYESGNSQLQWPDGKHNSYPSNAVDVAPYISGVGIDWENTAQFYHFAGYVQGVAESMGITIRCGCDWNMNRDVSDQTFDDLVHFEILE